MSQSDGCFWNVKGRRMVGEINGDDVKKLTITEAWLKIDGPMLITNACSGRSTTTVYCSISQLHHQ